MLDWKTVVFNSSWVIGTALALATLSHAIWVAGQARNRLQHILTQPGYQRAFNLAGLLFCLGLAGTMRETWKLIGWLIIAGLFTARLVRIRHN